MTIIVGAFEAKTKLSALLDKVEQGEEVVITRRGKEVARMTRPSAHRSPKEAEAVYKRLMKISREGGKILRESGIKASSTDHDELFYDEYGLPK